MVRIVIGVGGILTGGKGTKLDPGLIARVLDGHDSKATEIDAAAFPFRIAVLDDEGLYPSLGHTDAKALQLSIP